MLSRRLIHLLITSLFAALAVVPTAAAPPDREMTRTTRVFLDAFSPEAGISVFLFQDPESGSGYTVCVSTPEGFGCVPVAEDIVQVDEKHLTTATLDPVTIPIERCDESGCGPAGEVTVDVTFTGTGEISRSQFRSKFSNGCTVMSSSKGTQREGDATITIDGTTYAARGFLAVSRNTFKVQCRLDQ